MLTRRGIEANPEKFQEVVDIRSLTNVKAVQQITGRLVALFRFLSCPGDKDSLFFIA